MNVHQVMTPNVRTIQSEATIFEAARIMREANVGVLLVVAGKRLLGTVTDRDIVTQAIATGRDVTRDVIGTVMTDDVMICRKGDRLGDVVRAMMDNHVHRLPVLNSDDTIAGIISIDDIARLKPDLVTGEVVSAIAGHGELVA